MELIVLGIYAPYPAPEGACPGYLIKHKGESWLLDCGSGTVSRLTVFCPITDLTGVILSHLHTDHISDVWILGNAIYRYTLHRKLKNSVYLLLPDEPEKEYNSIILNRTCFSITHINEDLKPPSKMNISFKKVNHPYTCYATKIEADGKVFVYTGDTAYLESLVDFCKGADLLLCEAGVPPSTNRPNDEYHIQTYQAAEIAKKAKVKKLLLTHFSPDVRPQEYLKETRGIFTNTELATENRSYYV